MPPTWAAGALRFLTPESDALLPPYPDILITCGKPAIALSLALGRATSRPLYRIHILNPQMTAGCFDKVVAPRHDGFQAPNVLQMEGSLNGITTEKLGPLEEEGRHFFAAFPRPWVVFLLGGSTNRYAFTAQTQRALLEAFEGVLRSQLSLLIMSSPRTPSPLNEKIEGLRARNAGRVFFFDGKGPNPYLISLASADFIVVTDDSVNMLSEACATGKPVFIFPLPGHGKTPPVRFAAHLMQRGLARAFVGGPFETWSYMPLNETSRIAGLLKNDVEMFLSKTRKVSPTP